ncbi:MAG: tetratricopeptide repeat protein [Deltaproteobacteria bacterium]|nr:tetratricopeptide repeat protein [Deltaproteobacteria bacterium]
MPRPAGLVLAAVLLLALPGCFGGGAREVPAHLAGGNAASVQGEKEYRKGCWQKALKHFTRAWELEVLAADTDKKAVALNNMGNCHRMLGDPQTAAAFLEEAAKMFSRAGDAAGEIRARINLAAALADAGRADSAKRELSRALALPGGADYWPLWNVRGIMALDAGDLEEAGKCLDRALAAPGGPEGGRAAAHYSMGRLMLETGKLDAAQEHFSTAFSADRQDGYFPGVADDLLGLGRVAEALGNLSEAAGYYADAAQVYGLLGMDGKAQDALSRLEAADGGEGAVVTRHFLAWWGEGYTLEAPCE